MIKKKFDKINNEEVKLLSSEIINEGGAVLSDLFDLSMEETVIGTFNNKPIYRRIIVNTTANGFDTGITNIDTVLKMEMIIRQNNGSSWRNVPWLFCNNDNYGLATWAGGFYLNGTTGYVATQVGTDLGGVDKLVFIIEYTKK